MPDGEGSSSGSVARPSMSTPARKAIRSKLVRRGRQNIEALNSVRLARKPAFVTSGGSLRPLTEAQKECMVAAISAPLRGLPKGNLVDCEGAVHWWKTVKSLVERGVLVPYRQGQYRVVLTEVGMLAALWLDQEAREEI